ncbi:MAG TPA: hypothetical protein VK638_12730 [Edaphobacter sp.]|nr:hypothetical protein [Edaphobacter sp.]
MSMRHPRIAVTLLLTSACAFSQSGTQVNKPFPSTGFLKHLTLESFGYTSSATAQGYEFSSTTTSALYNLHGLECPLCVPGPQNRVRQLLPPFGAKASLSLWQDRLILFAGFSGINAVTWGNSPRISPIAMRATPDNDAWLVQRQIGASVAVDPEKHLSLGISQRYLNDFGPSKTGWTTTTGNLSFSPGLFREVVRGIKSVSKPSAR